MEGGEGVRERARRRERGGEERRASGATRWVEWRGVGRRKVDTGLRERVTKAERGEQRKGWQGSDHGLMTEGKRSGGWICGWALKARGR